MHEVHTILAGARPRQGDTDDPENWARYDLIWPHLGPSEAWNCDEEEPGSSSSTGCATCGSAATSRRRSRLAASSNEQWQEKIGAGRRADPLPALPHRQRAALAGPLRGGLRAGHGDLRQAAGECSARRTRRPCRPRAASAATCAGSAGSARRSSLDEETYSRNKEAGRPRRSEHAVGANNLAVDLRLVGDCFPRARSGPRRRWNYRQRRARTRPPLYAALGVDAGARHARGGRLRGVRRTAPGRPTSATSPSSARTSSTPCAPPRAWRSRCGRWAARRGLRADPGDRRPLRARLRANHPDALACKLNLACDLSARDDKAAALRSRARCSRPTRKHRRRRTRSRWRRENNISTYLRGIGSVREALELADRTLTAHAGRARRGPPVHLVLRQINRANCLHDLGRLSDAESLQRETLERLRKTLGARHPTR